MSCLQWFSIQFFKLLTTVYDLEMFAVNLNLVNSCRRFHYEIARACL